jgi:threonylcarbamoyladenosine tRNA methylthiotransferase CDKAL1
MADAFGDIEDVWKNDEIEQRVEKTEITLKKNKNKERKEKAKQKVLDEKLKAEKQTEQKIWKIDNDTDNILDSINTEEKSGCCGGGGYGGNIGGSSGGCCNDDKDDGNNNKSSNCCSGSGEEKISNKINETEEGGKCCGSDPYKTDITNIKLNKMNEINEKLNEEYNVIKNKSYLPGIQKVFVKTYGCSHNTSDSEFMMGLLNEYGYQLVDNFESSDACVINSCTVKNPSQDAFSNYISKAKKNGKKVILSGCVPQGDRTLPGLEDCSVVGVTQIDRIVEVVEETLKGNIVKLLAKKDLPSLDLPKIRRNKYVEIIPINTGCLGSCTYCKTKHARGKLGSYEVDAIVKACLRAAKEGVREIWLTSEDTGAYGRDINTDLPTLMMEILKVIPDDVMIRVGMTNPPYIMEHLDKIAKVLNHPNCFGFLHIPVQAGSNKVLDKMNREYKVEDFELVCDYLIANVPNMTIATDVICGFPSETKEQFDETLDLIDKYRFPVVNISQFYSRPGTVAAKWKKVNSIEVKRRSREVSRLFNQYNNYEHLRGSIQRVWVHDNKDEGKAPGEEHMIAVTKAYVKVLLKRDSNLLGKQILIKITDIHKWHIYGEIIDMNPRLIKVNFYDHFKGIYKENQEENKDYTNKVKALYKNQNDIHSTFEENDIFSYQNNVEEKIEEDKKFIMTNNIDENLTKNELLLNNEKKINFVDLIKHLFLFLSIICFGMGILEFLD